MLVEEAEESPDTAAGAVVVFGFDIYGSFLDFGRSAGGLPEMGFGVKVTV